MNVNVLQFILAESDKLLQCMYTVLCVLSKVTPRCSREVSDAGLPWLKHFKSSMLFVGKIFVSRLLGVLLSHKTWILSCKFP